MVDLFRKELNRYFLGKREITDNVISCFLAGGHVLLEDVPGVGKTTLARAFAGLSGLSFGRIQFTPDTLPGDVTGMNVYDMKKGEFLFRPGAVMKNVVLADELNRATPKTQSALLEAMEESHITVDGVIYPLPKPFMVIATQNPISFVGTYPLPEAQLDRFMMRLSIGYPSEEEELRIAKEYLNGMKTEDIKPVPDIGDTEALKKAVEEVYVSDAVLSYGRAVIAATRNEDIFSLGASPRAMLHLIRVSRARAFLQGRSFVKPDDIKETAVPVLAHRLIPARGMRLEKKSNGDILSSLLLKIPVPAGDYDG